MFFLQLRMWILVTILFGIIYAVLVMLGTTFFHVGGFTFYLILSLAMMLIQYILGPKIVEWTMRIKYVSRKDYPRLFDMVESLAMRAQIPVPRIGIAQIVIPNAFAFGRSLRDGRVCVTEGIIRLLDEDELKAVLGHELTHLKNRDVLTITLLSVIPMVMYRIAWQFLFYGRRRDGRGGNTILIGLAAFIFYFITNLLVLYASRIREYFADRGSILLGNQPATLASSLYKLVYGSARIDKESLKEVEGLKAFFVNDPSQALHEIRELSQLDRDKSGTIDAQELALLRNKNVRLGFGDKMMELLSTHPNMLKRIKQLSTYKV
ncbi:MAG: zinc metalloprotease HtpX [Candidatus Omnitrophica bacterium]|nr:zinc metalloprotease HtpX [Candidatus Omnitrophota bacterium]